MKLNFQFFQSVILALLLTPVNSQSIITDRPDQTESAITVEPGILQIESGIINQVNGDGVNRFRNLIIPTNLIRYGISNRVELRMVFELDGKKTTTNPSYQFALGNLELGAKIGLNKHDDSKINIGLLSHLKLPKSDGEKFFKNLAFINRISLEHQISEIASLGYNLGYNYFINSLGNFIYTIAFGYAMTERISLYLEPYGNIFINDIPLSNFDFGVTYLLKSNLQLDMSFGYGLNNSMNYQSIGISWKQKGTNNIQYSQ